NHKGTATTENTPASRKKGRNPLAKSASMGRALEAGVSPTRGNRLGIETLSSRKESPKSGPAGQPYALHACVRKHSPDSCQRQHSGLLPRRAKSGPLGSSVKTGRATYAPGCGRPLRRHLSWLV